MPLFLTVLTLISGISWSIVYLELINRGFRDKSYGMPLFALAFNLAWECVFAFVVVGNGAVSLQRVINGVWFALDLVIAFTYLRYGAQYFSKAVDRRWFLPWSAAALVVSFATIYACAIEFPDLAGARYSAFAQNLMMSVLFVGLVLGRSGVEGQSMVVAIFKWIGTFAPTIQFYLQTGSLLILALGLGCFFYDVVYIILLERKFRGLGLNPFTRRVVGISALGQ
jgi:hypothetical protein